jgi:hypothetical protein
LADSKGGGNPSGTEVPNSQETRTARASIRLRIRTAKNRDGKSLDQAEDTNSQDSEEPKTILEEPKPVTEELKILLRMN